jgi:hypothetical protein
VFNEFLKTLRKLVAITKNICLQMNGLFDAKYVVFVDSFKKNNYYEIFDNLGSMLTNLYIVDLIINENTAFQDYWQQYNLMFAKVKSNMDSYNMTSKMVKRLQKFVETLYNTIMHGKLYQEYLDGLKNVIKEDMKDVKDPLFKNKTFQEKYLEYINIKINDVQVLLSAQGEMTAQAEYMNLLINYSVYRKLFDIEDDKIYKKIWALQKFCPILIMYNNLYVIPGNFLATVCPLKKKTSVEPPDVPVFLR